MLSFTELTELGVLRNDAPIFFPIHGVDIILADKPVVCINTLIDENQVKVTLADSEHYVKRDSPLFTYQQWDSL